jgi:hypothetical protein
VTFGEALEMMRENSLSMTRHTWHADERGNQPHVYIGNDDNEQPCLRYCKSSGRAVVWASTHADLLAKDWEVLEWE